MINKDFYVDYTEEWKGTKRFGFQEKLCSFAKPGRDGFEEKERKENSDVGNGYILLTENKEACDHVALNVQSVLWRALLQVRMSIGSHFQVIKFIMRKFRVKKFKGF